jgi:hypothetical protein
MLVVLLPSVNSLFVFIPVFWTFYVLIFIAHLLFLEDQYIIKPNSVGTTYFWNNTHQAHPVNKLESQMYV